MELEEKINIKSSKFSPDSTLKIGSTNISLLKENSFGDSSFFKFTSDEIAFPENQGARKFLYTIRSETSLLSGSTLHKLSCN